mgnify:CR=1 FL=1
MKSLGRIVWYYLAGAVLVLFLILCLNTTVFLWAAWQNFLREPLGQTTGSRYLADIEARLIDETDGVAMKEEGIRLLEQSAFVWAMVLDEEGNRIWEWQVPDDIRDHYSRNEVAAFSRWYLEDYPVRVWTHGEDLLVLGEAKDSVGKYTMEISVENMKRLPGFLFLFLGSNVLLILVLCLGFGYRLYRSLKPVVHGIMDLSQNRQLHLREKGVVWELAAKVNQVSKILVEQQRRLEQRDNARTSWIAGVSHDIRTPLALVLGYSDTLAADRSLNEKVREKVQAIRTQSLQIRHLIEDLNLTSKLEYDAQPLRRQRFYPANLLRECVAEFYNEGLEKRYEIGLEIPQETERIQLSGDVKLWKRAVRNLIRNSIEHNPGGCTMELSVFWREGKLCWRFWDSGPGITPSVKETLEKTEISSEKGVHVMGLRIVRQIARAHGGELLMIPKENGNFLPEIQISV